MSGGTLVVALALGASVLGVVTSASATEITNGPGGDSVQTSPTFTFAAAGGNRFECSLDSEPFAPCASPDTIGPLTVGPHTFIARRSDDATDTPAQAQWTVVAPLQTPTLTLASPKRSKLHPRQLQTISGSASSPSGVGRVQVALYRGAAEKSYFPPACRFVDLHTGKPDLEPCLLPPYDVARGSTSWRYVVRNSVRNHLRPGRYHLVVRALNGYGDATRHNFPLTVR